MGSRDPYKGYIYNHSQVIAVRLLLGALKTGVSPGFAYSFAAIFFRRSVQQRELCWANWRMQLMECGELFAYAFQPIDN
jgi:hypothetical protein